MFTHAELTDAAARLSGHPWIAEALPGADGTLLLRPGPSALAARPVPGGLVAEYLEHWGEVYDWTYTRGDGRHAEDLDLSGWRASDTGQPLPVEHMRAWVEHTVDLVAGLRPRRILELGCGTGLLAHRLRGRAEGYVGTDVSGTAVERLSAQDLPGTAFVRAGAHEAASPEVRAAMAGLGFPEGRPDCVVINSVTQCFPGVAYLRAVLHDAIELVEPGGSILVGDVRDARLLDHFARWAEHGDPEAAAERRAREPELLFDPPLLARLARESGRTVRMSVHPKTMTADTELTRYRFDAVLRIDSPSPEAVPVVPWSGENALKEQLAEGPVRIGGIPNALLAPGPDAVTPHRLRDLAAGRAAVVADPADPARLALVSPPEAAPRPVEECPGSGTAHDPLPAFVERRLSEVARAVLRRSFPVAVLPSGLPDRADALAEAAVGQEQARELPEFLRRLDEAALAAMALTLRPAGEARSEGEVAAALGVADRHRWILRRWLAVLAAEGEPGPVATTGLAEEGERLGYPAETTRFMLAAMARLPELLRDELTLQALLFEDPKTADGAYRENTVNRYLNAGVAEVMRWAREKTPQTRPLRVLELGAGVGGTTMDALDALAGEEIDYHFTDVSRYFLSLGRERFGHRKGVRFGLFDINEDPLGQGVPPGSLDVVLSANVLHNARDIRATLSGLRELLAPDGLFVFVETSRELYSILTSMQFLMSAPQGRERLDPADPRAADDRVFLSRREWRDELERAGLNHWFTLPRQDRPLSATGLHLFVARRAQPAEAEADHGPAASSPS
ncbi:methyltransferase [Actinocorallia populi]|uniref:methyltransferase n=1 Tax=Actinocorallia populi TaxID=2079200 RepID=UPI0018E50228|nr:methyltransferase [Actinocorallia populi]